MIEKKLVVHPCHLTITSTVHDSPQLTTCGSITTRFWQFSDSCGVNTSFKQLVEVLPLQEPLQPQNGAFNVELGSSIIWPIYLNTDYYLLSLWRSDKKMIESKRFLQNNYTLTLSENYLPNTSYLWQVHYVLKSGISFNNVTTVPSPIWRFTTKPYVDYKLISVSGPIEVFTGHSFQVSWKVLNIGSNRNNKFYWYDKLFISKDKNANDGHLIKLV